MRLYQRGLLQFFGAFAFCTLLLAGIGFAQGSDPAPGDAAPAAAAPGDAAPAAAQTDTAAPKRGQTSLSDLKAKGGGATPMQRLQSVVGVVGLLGLAFALSNNRRRIDWKVVAWGTALQLGFAFLILVTTPGRMLFSGMNDAVVALLGFTEQGASFVFGNLIHNNVPVGTPLDGGPPPFTGGPAPMAPVIPPGQTAWANVGSFFAFSVLPTIIFFSALMTVLYHVGIMQHVVNFFTRVMQKTMKTSGSETLSAAANIFLGQTEAPLCVKPYVGSMTNSELMAVMVGGFANTAGGVLAAYVGMLKGYFPDIAGHLISVSVMSAPASLVIAKMMFPETEPSQTRGELTMKVERIDANVIDAAARGAGEGLQLALNVAAMLIAFIALIALGNAFTSWAFGLVGRGDINLQTLFGYLFWPIAWLMGIPAADCTVAGKLLGTKTVINEFVAYLDLSNLLQNSPDSLSDRSKIIVTYALCGFANFSSIAIQIGGIAGLAPHRRSDLARLGLRAMVGGSIATFMCAAITGLLI
jgi:CNT family concentrative nucleoside transporter